MTKHLFLKECFKKIHKSIKILDNKLFNKYKKQLYGVNIFQNTFASKLNQQDVHFFFLGVKQSMLE